MATFYCFGCSNSKTVICHNCHRSLKNNTTYIWLFKQFVVTLPKNHRI